MLLICLNVMKVESSMPDPKLEEMLRRFSKEPTLIENVNKTNFKRLKQLAEYERQLEGNQDIVTSNVSMKLQWPFRRWEKSGVDTDMTSCCIQILERGNRAFIQISHGGRSISVKHSFLKKKNKRRFRAMEKGVREAVKYAREHMHINHFPDLYALFIPSDNAAMERTPSTRCNSPTQKEKEWPPIFTQNRLYGSDNLHVLIPDFSYFISSGKSVPWFDEVEKELEYSDTEFALKEKTAVYRGTFIERKYEELRRALLPLKCPNEKLINVSSYQYLSHRDMCSGHQLIITLPGNGAWSWATKYNLLCNSVTAMVSPDSLRGESWETRESLGMKPGIHYLELTSNVEEICEDLKTKVLWTKKYPKEASMMAKRSREIALTYLNRNTVLKDFATLLLGYSSLNKSINLQPEVKKILLDNFSYDNFDLF